MKKGIVLIGLISVFFLVSALHAEPPSKQPKEKAPVPTSKQPKAKAPVAKTGQTISYAVGDDGDLQKGVPLPIPRFTDQKNGAVTDNLTGLIWLRQMDCIGQETWYSALESCNTLAAGQCGLTDGSIQGDWRLPNIKEFTSLVDYSKVDPVLSSGHPFQGNVNFGTWWWWTSTTNASNDLTIAAWAIELFRGTLAYGADKAASCYGMCVR